MIQISTYQNGIAGINELHKRLTVGPSRSQVLPHVGSHPLSMETGHRIATIWCLNTSANPREQNRQPDRLKRIERQDIRFRAARGRLLEIVIFIQTPHQHLKVPRVPQLLNENEVRTALANPQPDPLQVGMPGVDIDAGDEESALRANPRPRRAEQ